jgi:hypothetical protein
MSNPWHETLASAIAAGTGEGTPIVIEAPIIRSTALGFVGKTNDAEFCGAAAGELRLLSTYGEGISGKLIFSHVAGGQPKPDGLDENASPEEILQHLADFNAL